MRKVIENQTLISGDSLLRVKVALVQFNAENSKTHKRPKSELKKSQTQKIF